MNPNLGCSDLTSLMVNRLRGAANFDKKYFHSTYAEFELDKKQKTRYPEALHRHLSTEDVQVFEKFPTDRLLMYSTFYDDDPLIPCAFTLCKWIFA